MNWLESALIGLENQGWMTRYGPVDDESEYASVGLVAPEHQDDPLGLDLDIIREFRIVLRRRARVSDNLIKAEYYLRIDPIIDDLERGRIDY